MPREPLRQEQVPRDPVHVRDRRVPKRVERVEAIEACLDLKLTEKDLHAPRSAPSLQGAIACSGVLVVLAVDALDDLLCLRLAKN
jgi:hypothetical protein